ARVADNPDPFYRATNVAVGNSADGRLVVVAVGTDNVVRHSWQAAANSTTFDGWRAVAGNAGAAYLATSVAVGHSADGRLVVVAVGTDNIVRHSWQAAANSTTFDGWRAVAGNAGAAYLATSVAVGHSADGRLV